MALALQTHGASLKIGERSEAARREFFKKVEKLTSKNVRISQIQELADQAANEYTKVFGRIGVHPLMHVKGGKKPIRYVVDRDETWVLYKPALWQMGGSLKRWGTNVDRLVSKCSRMEDGQKKMLQSEDIGIVQEWHGFTQGLAFCPQQDEAERPGWKSVVEWGFIQRLDVETDGPVVIAKTWRAQRALQVQMREHVFSKGYMCLVHGRLENKVHYLRQRFTEIGSESGTQVMLRYDAESDPFYEWSQSGRWPKRKIKMAETFFKPIAYYRREEDNTDYSLVYVNILSGITHQVRITLQTSGHPLVSDDRYLPKEQALSDLKWCPRNFLTEVRSDWFDLCGPFKDEKRRKYHRVCLENPLPKLFQTILETRLTLVDKLDPTADLYVGPEYWAMGDEQLMNAFPKDDEYRRKVMRWGQRRGIHLEALDRLLLLSKEDITFVLNSYKGPNSREEPTWICPICMAYNQPGTHRSNVDGQCTGALGADCPGQRVNDDGDMKVPKGWFNWLADPTIHLLMIVNHKWLEARREILRKPRPSWEKPPVEAVAQAATKEILGTLEAALVLNLKAGGMGIMEDELPNVPGLEDIKLPLGAPPEDSTVHRSRRPGSGVNSRWLFTLKGEERIRHSENYAVKTERLFDVVNVKTEKLPAHMVTPRAEVERKKKQNEENEMAAEKRQLQIEAEKVKAEKRKLEDEQAKKEDARAAAKRPRIWKKLESSSNPGNFYFFDAENGQSTTQQPPDYKETTAWERIESKTVNGEFYYFNHETGESRVDRPRGVPIQNDTTAGAKSWREEEHGILWKRTESKTQPGSFYYMNPATNIAEVSPPTVQHPWVLCESKSVAGQFYYFHEETKETVLDPPPSARPAAVPKPGMASIPPAKQPSNGTNANVGEDLLPGWRKASSSKYPGKFYFVQESTNTTSWERPALWEERSSASNPGKVYFVNKVSGETQW